MVGVGQVDEFAADGKEFGFYLFFLFLGAALFCLQAAYFFASDAYGLLWRVGGFLGFYGIWDLVFLNYCNIFWHFENKNYSKK